MGKSNSEGLALRSILVSWAKAVRAKDIAGVLARHAKDILMFDVVPPLQLKGLRAYEDSWTQLFFPWYGQDGDFTLSDLKFSAGDRVAFATGLIHCAGKEHGKRVKYTIRLTVGFKKRGGRWTIVHEHHSEPVPAA